MRVAFWGMVWMCLAWCFGQDVAGAEIRASVGGSYDSNLFEQGVNPQGGWINRISVMSKGVFFQSQRGRIELQHQGGFKRLWKTSALFAEMGDVTVNHLELLGQAQVSARWWVSGGGQLKLKQATRVPGEESYLRGKINGRVSTRLLEGGTGGVFFRVSREDARDPALAQVAFHVLGVEGRWSRTRKFVGLVRGTWYWLDYDRTALLDPRSGNRAIRSTRQADVLREFTLDLQVYQGGLFHVGYGFLDNRSNSFGFGYRAHRIRMFLMKHIGYLIDAQSIISFQVRKYDDVLRPASGRLSEEDEYEQTIATLKFSRQLNSRFGLSAQYGFYRNGA
ncbi:MAG: hypothetical protein O7G87_16765, partial [bacterium]|nr:hypothetical protein [bacterium]